MSIRQNVFGATVATLTLAAVISATPDQVRADANPYIGDVLITGANYCPRGWTAMDGQLLPIASYTAVFSLVGTTYGGDGRTTFGIPDMRGRMAMGQGRGAGLTTRSQGQKFGVTTHTLSVPQMPQHSHTVMANNLDGDKPGPADKLLAAAPPNGAGSETIYSDQPATVQMSSSMIGNSGGNQPLNITDPSQVLTYCFALEGVYPSRN